MYYYNSYVIKNMYDYGFFFLVLFIGDISKIYILCNIYG